MFGIGETELFIIILFGFMVFGPDKLPGAGRTLGRALRQFRTAQEGFTKVVQTEIVDPATEMLDVDAAKPNRNRAAELEDDADIETDDSDNEAPRKKETFAERKARLAAERAEAKAAEEAAAQAEAAHAAEGAEAEGAAASAEPASASPDGNAKPAHIKPSAQNHAAAKRAKPTAAADLYAKPAKKHLAKAAAETTPAEEATAAPAIDEAGKEDEARSE